MTEAEQIFYDFQDKKDVPGLVKKLDGLEKGNKDKWELIAEISRMMTANALFSEALNFNK